MATSLLPAIAMTIGATVMITSCSSPPSSQSETSSITTSDSVAAPAMPGASDISAAPNTPAAGAPPLEAQLRTADGTPVANATVDFVNGYATVTIGTVAAGILTPGFHGVHIHSVGKCEANSASPGGGALGDFNSAGGHFQIPGHTGHPSSGDLSSLQVRSDGSAAVVTTTDAFTAADLTNGLGTALIIHEGADNFGNIPQRYTQDGIAGPDSQTLATGDAGGRVACGVISAAAMTGS